MNFARFERGLRWGASCLSIAVVAALAGMGIVALANQSNTWSPTTGTVSGLQLTTNFNNAFSAVQSCNSGSTAPENDQSAAAVKGQCWLDTSTTPNTVKQYDGTSWVTVGWIDTASHLWIGNNGGGVGTIASAATTDLGSIANPIVNVTGTTTITSFGSSAIAGTVKHLIFGSTGLTLTYNGASMLLPSNGGDIVTQIGDTATAIALGSGNWRIEAYSRASGAAALGVSGQVLAGGANVTPLALSDASQTLDCGKRPIQTLTNNAGAITLTAPGSAGSCVVLVTNGASAGAITMSGFSVGSTPGTADTTSGHKFTYSIWGDGTTFGYQIIPHQ